MRLPDLGKALWDVKGKGVERKKRQQSVWEVCEQFDCPNPPCMIHSEAKAGHYADSRDCRNFCFMSGNKRTPSKFQRCAGGTVWDPSCGNEGCCNYPEDANTSHCKMV